MKKILSFVFVCGGFLFLTINAKSQAMKIGVFDLDVMVQAMPGYHIVDSLVKIYETDSLGAEYQYNQSEYVRLDSAVKSDSALVAQGKKSKAMLDLVSADRQKYMINLVYWQQISQNKSNNKRGQLAQSLYTQVSAAYKKILDKKKYTLILKPQTYEFGFRLDNIFIAVARELKLTDLPQDLLYLGDDPDPVKQTQTQKPPANKPKN